MKEFPSQNTIYFVIILRLEICVMTITLDLLYCEKRTRHLAKSGPIAGAIVLSTSGPKRTFNGTISNSEGVMSARKVSRFSALLLGQRTKPGLSR